MLAMAFPGAAECINSCLPKSMRVFMVVYTALRAVSESVFESFPQLVMQLWMRYGPHGVGEDADAAFVDDDGALPPAPSRVSGTLTAEFTL